MADGKTKKQRRVESLTERLDYTRARIDELLNVFDARIHELEAATPALADALRSASALGRAAPPHLPGQQTERAEMTLFFSSILSRFR